MWGAANGGFHEFIWESAWSSRTRRGKVGPRTGEGAIRTKAETLMEAAGIKIL